MKGSVRKKGASWSYRVEFGLVNGKRNQIERSGYRTKKEAEKALNDVLYQYNNTANILRIRKLHSPKCTQSLSKVKHRRQEPMQL